MHRNALSSTKFTILSLIFLTIVFLSMPFVFAVHSVNYINVNPQWTKAASAEQNYSFNISIFSPEGINETNITIPGGYGNISVCTAPANFTCYITSNSSGWNITARFWNATNVTNGSIIFNVTVVNVSNITTETNYTWNITTYNETGFPITNNTINTSVDGLAPSISFNQTISGFFNTIPINLTLSDAGSNLSTTSVKAYLSNATAPYNYSATTLDCTPLSTSFNCTKTMTTTSVADGNYTIWVNATDTVGNLKAVNGSTNAIYIDNTPPPYVYNISITPNGTMERRENISITFTVNDSVNGSGLNTSKVNVSVLQQSTYSAIFANVTMSCSTSGFYSAICTGTWNTDNSTNDTYFFNVTAYDNLNNVNITSVANTTYVNLTATPDLIVSNIFLHKNGTTTAPPANLNPGDYIIVNATITNLGLVNASGNITVRLLWDGGPLNDTNVSTTLNLTAQSSVNATFNITSANVSSISGFHTITIIADPNNINNETSESNNTKTADAMTILNVTIFNIIYNGVGYTDTTQAAPKPTPENITLNVTVRYPNSSYVPNLDKSNFTLLDYFNSNIDRTGNLTLIASSSSLTAGYYTFNYTVPPKNNSAPNQAEAGNHTLKLFANSTGTGTNFSGWNYDSNYGYSRYNLRAPNLTVYLYNLGTNLSFTGAGPATNSFSVLVMNTGPTNLTNVLIKLSNTSYLTLSNNSCQISTLNYTTSWVTCMSSATITSATPGTYTLSVSSAGGYSGDDNSVYNATSLSFTITVTNSSAAGTTGGTGGGGRTCTANADCESNQYCSGGSCITLSCATDEMVVNHACVKKYKLTVTEYPSSVELLQGNSTSKTVKVRNDGQNTTTNVRLAFSGDASTYYSSTPSPITSVLIGNTATFTMNINVSSNATIGNYTTKIWASSTEADGTVVYSNLKILPTEETKAQINASLKEIEANITIAKQELEDMLKQYNTTNLTAANATLTQINTLLKEAKDAIAAGDYITASQKLNQIKNLLADMQKTVTAEKARLQGISLPSTTILIIVGVIIAAVAIVVVKQVLIPRGYHPAKGYTPPAEKSFSEALKEKMKSLKEKFKRKPKEAKPGYSFGKRVKWSVS